MAAEPGGKLLHPASDPGKNFIKKSAEMVLLSVVGNRVRAVVLSGAAGDGNQPDPGETAGSGDTDAPCTGGRHAVDRWTGQQWSGRRRGRFHGCSGWTERKRR